MTKTKIPSALSRKSYLFMATFFFLSVLFVRVDGARSVAKADTYSDCTTNCSSQFNTCYDAAVNDPNSTDQDYNDCSDNLDTCDTSCNQFQNSGSATTTGATTTDGTPTDQSDPTYASCISDLANNGGGDGSACCGLSGSPDVNCGGMVPAAGTATTATTSGCNSCIETQSFANCLSAEACSSTPDTTGWTDAQCKDYNPKAYASTTGTCQVFDPNTESCTPGAEGDADCVTAKGSGFVCDSDGDCVVGGAAGALGSECRTGHNEDCTEVYGDGFTCNSSGLVNKCVAGAATAAQKAAAQSTALAANTAAASVNAAKANVNTANAAVAANCADPNSAQCLAAQQQASNANAALVQANANFDTAIANANAAALAVNPSTTTGAGFNMCSNGLLAIACSALGSTTASPITTGLNLLGLGAVTGTGTTGTVSGAGGNLLNGGTSTIACGTGFTSIGGVCFPTNTGLSSAPISTILTNLFSWLMGLFTTLAIMAFVISGLQYLTAAGDEGRMEDGKKNATYAILGIIIGLSGFVIIQAIAAALSGSGYMF